MRRALTAGFDTEDDGKGNPFLWAFTHDHGSWWSRSRDDARQYVANLADRKGGCELWATNLEYDLLNLFTPENIAEVTLRFGRSALVGADWRKARMRDTMRHVPLSVAQLGALVGLEKRERNLFKGTRRSDQQYVRRCLRDAAITYRSAVMLHTTYRRLGERPRMTLASTALALWRDRFWKRGIRRPPRAVWSASLDAYHGGRTQAFAVGTFDRVQVIDVASMFPWAMVTAPLPLPWGLSRRVRGGPIDPLGVYRVTVLSDLRFPRLPVRTRDGTIYPNGSWQAWYVGEELQAFERAGGRVLRVHEGHQFAERCEPFTDYVSTMFKKKQRARGGARTMYKLLLNALYGKFGQQGSRIRAVPIAELDRVKRPPVEWRPWCGLAIFSEDGPPPPWSNNLWPAIITARARVRLADEIERIAGQGARVLYCDTDSVMFQGDASYPAKARKIGEFESRGKFRRCIIVGKKEYALAVGPRTWETHVKGVPASERLAYLKTGRASFERPVRLRESGRIGVPGNVWRTVTKQRRRDLATLADGAGQLPTPIFIGEGVQKRRKGA